MSKLPAAIAGARTLGHLVNSCQQPMSHNQPNGWCTSAPSAATHHSSCSSSDQEDGGSDLWVFGYGSLVWKVDFPVAESQRGYIKGFWRRFYQHSIDHRGTPEKPGRVVTLIPATHVCTADDTTAHPADCGRPNDDARVYGVAHRIPSDQRAAVLEHLDHRERNGYVRYSVDFYPYRPDAQQSAAPRPICLYLATADNESFAGPLPVAQLAEQVLNAHGPSGPNVDYVYRLADAMRSLFPGERDEHLFELERTLRALQCNRNGGRCEEEKEQ